VTNATKASIIAVLNAGLGAAVLFGLNLTADQIAGVLAFANALGALIVGLTYKDSPKRIPDDPA